MMKTYPNQSLPIDQRIFNYRLSRARRFIETAFGIVTSRFRVLRRPTIAKTVTIKLISKAAVALHDYLIKKRTQNNENNNNYCPTSFTSHIVYYTRINSWSFGVRNAEIPLDCSKYDKWIRTSTRVILKNYEISLKRISAPQKNRLSCSC